MSSTICLGCGLRVEPVEVFRQSAKSKQWWIVTCCPRERCGYNLDITESDGPRSKEKDKDRRRYFWRDGNWE